MIGLFGGTFDPVHRGHIQIAEQIRVHYGLDKIVFIPALKPPHKDRVITDYQHRVAMLEATLAGRAGMEISRIESRRQGPSYTYDTLHSITHEYGSGTTYFLIIGADSFVEIHLWYKFRKLLEEIDLIVVARPEYPLEMVEKEFEFLPATYLPVKDMAAWRSHLSERFICYFDGLQAAVSSSLVRSRLAERQSIAELVPTVVQCYIDEHGLYSNFSPVPPLRP